MVTVDHILCFVKEISEISLLGLLVSKQVSKDSNDDLGEAFKGHLI